MYTDVGAYYKIKSMKCFWLFYSEILQLYFSVRF